MEKKIKIILLIGIIGIGYLIWINRFAIIHKLGLSERTLSTGINGNGFGQL